MDRKTIGLRREIITALKEWDRKQITPNYPAIRSIGPKTIGIRNCQGIRFIITIEKMNETS